MEELLHELGIDLKVVIIQALAFLIILIVLWRFVFGRIGGILENRRQDIHDQNQRIEETERQVGELKSELQTRLSGIEDEAKARLQAATDEASVEREKIVEEARRDAEGQIERARREIERERELAFAELKGQVADLAVAAASRVIEANLDADRHRKMIDDFISQLPQKGSDGGMN